MTRRAAKGTPSKYRAVRTAVDGITFASKAEARRYGELKLLERAGKIHGLEVQPPFDLVVMGRKVGRYVGDFAYYDRATKRHVLEDVKGMRTPVYRLKAKLMQALYGITISEVKA